MDPRDARDSDLKLVGIVVAGAIGMAIAMSGCTRQTILGVEGVNVEYSGHQRPRYDENVCAEVYIYNSVAIPLKKDPKKLIKAFDVNAMMETTYWVYDPALDDAFEVHKTQPIFVEARRAVPLLAYSVPAVTKESTGHFMPVSQQNSSRRPHDLSLTGFYFTFSDVKIVQENHNNVVGRAKAPIEIPRFQGLFSCNGIYYVQFSEKLLADPNAEPEVQMTVAGYNFKNDYSGFRAAAKTLNDNFLEIAYGLEPGTGSNSFPRLKNAAEFARKKGLPEGLGKILSGDVAEIQSSYMKTLRPRTKAGLRR